MPRAPWKAHAPAEPGRDYFALISYLPLTRFRVLPRFIRFTREVQRQLRSARGLIGYSLDAQPLHKTFWTLSVWEDRQSMMAFVREVPHSRVMQALAPHMGRTQFASWTVREMDLPLDWVSAKARLPL
jgi:hypothetical protein